MQMRSGLSALSAALSERNYRVFTIGNLVSHNGTWAQRAAVLGHQSVAKRVGKVDKRAKEFAPPVHDVLVPLVSAPTHVRANARDFRVEIVGLLTTFDANRVDERLERRFDQVGHVVGDFSR